MLILKIAFRNILRHRGKSLVVGVILFIGSLVMMIGGATITTMDKSVKNAMINKFFGDFTIMAKTQEKEDIFMQMMGQNADVLPQYNEVKEYLENKNEVEDYLPFAYGLMVMLAGSDNPLGYPAICAVIGVDINKYEKMFGNIKTLEGKIPPVNTKGMFLSKQMRDMFYMFNQDVYYPVNTPFKTKHLYSNLTESQESDLNIKNEIILMGYSSKNSTLDVSIPILGVFDYKTLGVFWKEVSLLDIDSYRQCMNYTLQNQEDEVSQEEARFIALEEAEIENLFSSENMIDEAIRQKKTGLEVFFENPSKNKHELERNFEKGIFEFVSVRLKPEHKSEIIKIINDFNRELDEKEIAAKAVSWEEVAGAIAKIVDGTRIGLYGMVFVVFIVAIVIIMNTLSMSVLERSSELAMMRTVGAPKKFISWMILSETFSLSAFFGGLGIIFGIPFTFLLAYLKIPVKNELLQMISGGPFYNPLLSVQDVLMGIVMLGFVTITSAIYPIYVSRKINLLDAIARD